MRLSELVRAIPESLEPCLAHAADEDPVVRGISYDSRAVTPGDLFVALRGELADGHDYVKQALELGAVALLVETPVRVDVSEDVPVVTVRESRRALAPLAVHYYGAPSQELALIGVTGTNGKTSTTYLVESILARAGRSVGLIGTLEIRYAGRTVGTLNTTPESLDLQRTLRGMRTAGVDAVAMEVSSHGIALGRIAGCRFRVAAFTNVSQDHLDFHGTMESYTEAKTVLFRDFLDANANAVVNLDDTAAAAFVAAARLSGARLIGVSRTRDDAEVRLEEAQITLAGSEARLRLPDGPLDLRLPLVGDFNLENLIVAVGVAVALDVDRDAIAEGVARCPQVPGRVERVGADLERAPTVLVDYAHTPDAVDKVLRTIRPLTGGRLITVFGCGGDRDRSKRPLMAKAVARWSDRIVATSDNPRTEDPEAILHDVESGLRELDRVTPDRFAESAAAYSMLVDRRAAIGLAIASADPDDTVVIAGKGHEDYQIIGRERLPFDDRVEARRALEARGAR